MYKQPFPAELLIIHHKYLISTFTILVQIKKLASIFKILEFDYKLSRIL